MLKRTLTLAITSSFFFCAAASYSNEKNAQKALQAVCNVFSKKWAGVNLHYKGGSSEFSQQCKIAIKDNSLLEGLWAIRSIVPDGHAEFNIKTKARSLIYPLVLNYDSHSNNITVSTILDKSLAGYVGKKVSLINGKNAHDFIKERAKLEPQSTYKSSLEIAARTIFFQPAWKPYPDFPESVAIVFEDGSKAQLHKKTFGELTKEHPYLISRNGYPSIWADVAASDKDICKTGDEVAKTVLHNNLKWLWWHPTNLNFDIDNLDKALPCFMEKIKEADGVILDLRDSAGGDYAPVIAVASVLGTKGQKTLKYKTAKGKIKETVVSFRKEKQPRWYGKIIMITNGLCGSACDFLADTISKRANVCTYGAPTAGRRIGTSQIKISNEILVEVPMRSYLDVNGESLEGKPFIPRHIGSGDIYEALTICSTL